MTAVVLDHRPRRTAAPRRPRPPSRAATPSRCAPPQAAPRAAPAWWDTVGSTVGSSALVPAIEVPSDRAPAGPGQPPAAPTVCEPPPKPATRPMQPLRLTRRGRLQATLAGTAFAALSCLTLVPAVAAGVASAFTGPPAPATTTVIVEPGQTLWQVAAAADPGGDTATTATTVARIADANGLTSAADLRPGQRLVVPVE